MQMWSITQKTGRVGGQSMSGISLTSKDALPSSEKGVEVVDVKVSAYRHLSVRSDGALQTLLWCLGQLRGEVFFYFCCH